MPVHWFTNELVHSQSHMHAKDWVSFKDQEWNDQGITISFTLELFYPNFSFSKLVELLQSRFTFAQATASVPLEGHPGWNLWFGMEEKTQYILLLSLVYSHRAMTQHLNCQPLLKVKQPRPPTKRQQMKHYLEICKVQCWMKQVFF